MAKKKVRIEVDLPAVLVARLRTQVEVGEFKTVDAAIEHALGVAGFVTPEAVADRAHLVSLLEAGESLGNAKPWTKRSRERIETEVRRRLASKRAVERRKTA